MRKGLKAQLAEHEQVHRHIVRCIPGALCFMAAVSARLRYLVVGTMVRQLGHALTGSLGRVYSALFCGAVLLMSCRYYDSVYLEGCHWGSWALGNGMCCQMASAPCD